MHPLPPPPPPPPHRRQLYRYCYCCTQSFVGHPLQVFDEHLIQNCNIKRCQPWVDDVNPVLGLCLRSRKASTIHYNRQQQQKAMRQTRQHTGATTEAATPQGRDCLAHTQNTLHKRQQQKLKKKRSTGTSASTSTNPHEYECPPVRPNSDPSGRGSRHALNKKSYLHGTRGR